jgi:Nucleotidyl transferase AbiEii toxin, Type IV TA system
MSRPTRAAAGGRAYLDLQNLARRDRRSTQELLVLYVLERFLARLAISRHREKFVLKGGMLLAALSARRPTVDADLLATHLSNETDEVLTRVVEITSTPMSPDDGVAFRSDTAKARIIREGDLYSGVRVTMTATVAEAAVKLQLDINFGDPVTPAPATITYPRLRDGLPPVQILGYPLATVLAEKLTTAIELGAGNSRIRDYADVWTLTGLHPLGAAGVRQALHTTAAHRGITLRPLRDVVADLASARAAAYTTYRRRLGQDAGQLPESLATVIDDVIAFADPLVHDDAAKDWDPHLRTWTPRQASSTVPVPARTGDDLPR